MSLDSQAILNRIDELLAKAAASGGDDNAATNEVYQAALTVIRAVHGPGSVQESQLIQAMSAAERSKDAGNWMFKLRRYVRPAVEGALRALRGDVTAGLVGNVAMQASGEVLGDLLGLAREALGRAVSNRGTWLRCWSPPHLKILSGGLQP